MSVRSRKGSRFPFLYNRIFEIILLHIVHLRWAHVRLARYKCTLSIVSISIAFFNMDFLYPQVVVFGEIVREYATSRGKRAGKTPQRGTSEEACLFVRGKGADSLFFIIESSRLYCCISYICAGHTCGLLGTNALYR